MTPRVMALLGATTGMALMTASVTTEPSHPAGAVLFVLVFGALGGLIGHFLARLGASTAALCLIPVLAGSCGALSVAANAGHTRNEYLLRADGVVTQATILESHPNNHNIIIWRYDTPSGEKRARGSAPFGRPASKLARGDRLDVLYSRSRPEVSMAREPYGTWTHAWAEGLALGWFGASWAVLIAVWQWRRLSRAD